MKDCICGHSTIQHNYIDSTKSYSDCFICGCKQYMSVDDDIQPHEVKIEYCKEVQGGWLYLTYDDIKKALKINLEYSNNDRCYMVLENETVEWLRKVLDKHY